MSDSPKQIEQREARRGSGVDRVIVWQARAEPRRWCIYEVKADKIAVVTLAGERTDPQTARFIEWLGARSK